MATAAQKAAAAERRDRMADLGRQVAAMTPAERSALVDRLGQVRTIEGHALSMHNTCMVLTQMPSASIVGGFRQWIDAGRCVRKGEHGAGIWVPIGPAKPAEGEEGDEDGKPRFRLATVFDVGQTDAAEARAAA